MMPYVDFVQFKRTKFYLESFIYHKAFVSVRSSREAQYDR
jgi:hypothetical protein